MVVSSAPRRRRDSSDTRLASVALVADVTPHGLDTHIRMAVEARLLDDY